ncbi:putative transposase [Bacteroidota bacterium]
MGEGTTRFVERSLCPLGIGTHATPMFEESKALCGAGILFMLPSLLAQGLLKAKEVFRLPASHYYGLESVVLTLAFMALGRIKNPEQLKQCKPGEIGRIIGLDRIPEVRCLREKIKFISQQQRSIHFNNLLIDQWYRDDKQNDTGFLYVDGHVRIYYGYKANLPSKYISRQKLCLSATSEFWVNDAMGMPVMMVMGELSEKLQTVIEYQIIPRLMEAKLILTDIGNQKESQCTFVFDREAYEPAFFQRLWERYRIAVITYRKNVKDKWDAKRFENIDVQVLNHVINMDICEQETEIGGYQMREIRRLGVSGHQTAIITTHPHLETRQVAGRMFARWSQENFFRYLIQDYDFDKMISFGVETIDMEKTVVNPQYRKVTYQLKKLREKKQRIESKFYPLVEQAIDSELEIIPRITDKQMQYKQILDDYNQEESVLVMERKKLQPHIKLNQMPEERRYNKLKTESKIFMNVIKMICYRAESAVASLLSPYLTNADKEKRMVVKQIIQANADVIPDYKNNILNVVLYSLSANRFNQAASELAELLNQTETKFPGTELRMVFKISANLDCDK